MSRPLPAKLFAWPCEPLSDEVIRATQRFLRFDDVTHVALMPDVHPADSVCVGTVLASSTHVHPEAVGGDIGCGMAALRVGPSERRLDRDSARAILSGLSGVVPTHKHPRRQELSDALDPARLFHDRSKKVLERDGAVQLGTLGRGNHFLELQADQEENLWLMVHSGSRALGPAILAQHRRGQGLPADSPEGRAYLADVTIALAYAEQNRRLILERALPVLESVLDVSADWDSLVLVNHNFVRLESHLGAEWWVHRKGASSARHGEPGIIPGSMGSESFHVEGRGCENALCSSSHGAGRALARGHAFRSIHRRRLLREMEGVWFDEELADRLRDEAPSAYKPIAEVMRAQKELVRIVRRLRPLLSYKGV
jgi:tRNA-splicing ligase RtcB